LTHKFLLHTLFPKAPNFTACSIISIHLYIVGWRSGATGWASDLR